MVIQMCDSYLCTQRAVKLVRVIDPGSGVRLAQCHACSYHLSGIRLEAAKPSRSPVKVFELEPGTDGW